MKRLLACLTLCASLSASAQDDNCTILGVQELTALYQELNNSTLDTCTTFITAGDFGNVNQPIIVEPCDIIFLLFDGNTVPNGLAYIALADGDYIGQRVYLTRPYSIDYPLNFAVDMRIPTPNASSFLTQTEIRKYHLTEAIWIGHHWITNLN